MTNTIRAIEVTPKGAKVVEIENTLEALQKTVGGYIEIVPIPEQSWVDVSYEEYPECAMSIICNEEGKLMHLTPSLVLGEFKWFGRGGGCVKKAHDLICGNCLIVATYGAEIDTLSDGQVLDALDWVNAWHIDTWEDVE